MHDVESASVGRVPETGRGLKGELATGPARVGRLVGPALGIVSLLLFLLLAEVLLRALGYDHLYVNPQPARFWRHDALLGWHHQAAASGVFDHRPQFMTRIRINDKGLRGKDYPYERVAGKRRVLVLGDSLVFGYGVEQDEVFTDVLEGMLPATEVINAGVSGYGTDQELLWFRSEGVRYRPDLVIILMTGNDEWENHESLVYWFYPKPHFTLSDRGELRLTNVPVPPPPVSRRLWTWVLRHSRTTYQAHLLLTSAFPGAPPARDNYVLTLALVDELKREVTAIGARLIVATTFRFWPREDPKGYERYGELVQRLRQRGFTTLDIDGAKGYAPDEMIIKDEGHWNALGHRFVARLIEPAIRGERP